MPHEADFAGVDLEGSICHPGVAPQPRMPHVSTTAAKGYVPEFDTLRALACIGVMIGHFAPFRGIPMLERPADRLGALGVDLFFALSGFLITGILLRCRDSTAEQSRPRILKQFYFRRALRIFPLYYLAIALCVACRIPGIAANLPWFLTYTVNYGKAVVPAGWYPLHHFWTLAVEEQFYLVWPVFVLFIRARYLPRLCWILIAVSFSERAILEMTGSDAVLVLQSTICCLEPLLMGAVCAIVYCKNGLKRTFLFTSLLVGAISSAAIVMFANDKILYILGRLSYAVLFSSIIGLLAVFTGSRGLYLLRLKPFLFLGRISYGVYVWHLPVLRCSLESIAHLPRWADRDFHPAANFAALFGVTIAAATASWFLFEGPLNGLKRRFPYLAEHRQGAH